MRTYVVWLFGLVVATGCGKGGDSPPASKGHEPAAEPAHEHAAPPPAVAGASPVQVEMQLLAGALEVALRGIGTGDLSAVEPALHRVHAAKEVTATALAGGSYRPPRNGDRLARFRELDEAFHGDLERLVGAARAGDVPAAADALGAAVRSCHGCHSEFRAPAP